MSGWTFAILTIPVRNSLDYFLFCLTSVKHWHLMSWIFIVPKALINQLCNFFHICIVIFPLLPPFHLSFLQKPNMQARHKHSNKHWNTLTSRSLDSDNVIYRDNTAKYLLWCVTCCTSGEFQVWESWKLISTSRWCRMKSVSPWRLGNLKSKILWYDSVP